MERIEWLKKVRAQSEVLYDHIAPAYWVKFAKHPDPTHRRFIQKFLERLAPHSAILDAACGAGLYDGILLEAGHSVLGIDQSGGMLAHAREIFPQERYPTLRYEKMGLQELDFQAKFDGVICMDALEHVSPEDWPVILDRFQMAIKPGGVLYLTVDISDADVVDGAYERARALGLPVVYGEVADQLDALFAQAMELDALEEKAVLGDKLDRTVYHYHPSMVQVRAWFDQAGLTIEEEGTGKWYAHLLARKNA